MIREDQYEALNERGLNLSGLIRDLVDDYLSDYKITLSVTEETRSLYDKIVSNTGSTDEDIEVYLKAALGHMLKDKIQSMKKLQEEVFGQS